MSFTLIILIVTVITSLAAFRNHGLFDKLILWPRVMNTPSEYHRLLTSGFIHADYGHLFFNMFTLFFFGQNVEMIFTGYGIGVHMFVVLYLTAIIVASLPSLIKHRNNGYYRSLGASGGVSAIVFSSIYFMPWSKIYVFFLPIPGIVAGVAFLAYSAYMSKRGSDNIGHDAHFWGAVYGFLFTLAFSPDHGSIFLQELMHPRF